LVVVVVVFGPTTTPKVAGRAAALAQRQAHGTASAVTEINPINLI
jgi:Sec-independent protein translocase protein TatA